MPNTETTQQRTIRLAVTDFRNYYLQITKEAQDELISKLEAGQTAPNAVKSTLARHSNIVDLANKAIEKLMLKSARVGFANRLPKGNAIDSKMLDKLLNTVWASDNKTLAVRLSENAQERKKAIQRTVEATLYNVAEVERIGRKIYDTFAGVQNPNTSQIILLNRGIKTAAGLAVQGDLEAVRPLYSAMDKLQRLINNGELERVRPAYLAVFNQSKTVRNIAISKAVKTAFEHKARYQIERIARTEASRAWFDGFIARYQNNDKVFGYRYKLSPLHNIFDQCDVLANINIGYGKGVYPKNNMPKIPRHPHCMCKLQPVYKSQVPPSQQLDVSKARKYIDGLTQEQRQQLFGIAGAEDVRSGADWQIYLRGWDGFTSPTSRLEGIIDET